MVASFENLQFSSDGKFVYFNTPAWTTSGAIHVVDTTTCREDFVIDGSLVNVLSSDAGDRLLVARRAYDKLQQGGGVYWDYFIVTPEGQVLKQLGLPSS